MRVMKMGTTTRTVFGPTAYMSSPPHCFFLSIHYQISLVGCTLKKFHLTSNQLLKWSLKQVFTTFCNLGYPMFHNWKQVEPGSQGAKRFTACTRQLKGPNGHGTWKGHMHETRWNCTPYYLKLVKTSGLIRFHHCTKC